MTGVMGRVDSKAFSTPHLLSPESEPLIANLNCIPTMASDATLDIASTWMHQHRGFATSNLTVQQKKRARPGNQKQDDYGSCPLGNQQGSRYVNYGGNLVTILALVLFVLKMLNMMILFGQRKNCIKAKCNPKSTISNPCCDCSIC